LQLAIDDFGTGYSSMSYLQKLPFTRMKIDKSFIDGLPHDSDSVSITRALLGLAKNFGLSVTAEGVEREEQLQFLKQEGCDEIQGYYFAKPMPLDAFIDFCKNQRSA
jgi:EAL domain-containing protein (putative c-di-GMP-specific phosphodiesterase class I)